MRLTQNHIEHLTDMLKQGKLTAAQANVEKVKMARVQVVKGRMSAQVRKALFNAVKTGELGHMKKDKLKPEVFFHPTFKYLAVEDRNKEASKAIKAISGVYV